MNPMSTSEFNSQEPVKKVIEVEVYMGKIFTEEIALQHCDFVKKLAETKREKMVLYDLNTERPLPVTTHAWGSKFAKMIKFLETVDS